jgi:hypothetical protein
MADESACGPVAVLVFKTSERGDEPRWWVRLPRALAITVSITMRWHAYGMSACFVGRAVIVVNTPALVAHCPYVHHA